MVEVVLKGFFGSKFNLGLVIALVAIGAMLLFLQPGAEPRQKTGVAVDFFYLPTCPYCKIQEPIILELQKEMPDVNFFFHDASSPEGGQLFYKMAAEAGLNEFRTPTTFVNGKPLVGLHSKEEIKAAILEFVEDGGAGQSQTPQSQGIGENTTEFDLPFLGKTNLSDFSLPVLAAVLGLVDGFNPCAMWVLVYLIALLMDVEDKKKMWVIVGSFIFASGALYFLFMTAWLNAFLVLGYIRAISIAIGLVALGGGTLNLKNYFTSKGKLECKVGDEKSHKSIIERIEQTIAQPLSITIILAMFALAFVVNSVEFVCSSAIPAVFTQILALKDIAMVERYAYILLYDFFFMLDDLIIFSLAVFAVNSSFAEKYAKYTKLIGGIILAILGIMLLFAPQFLL